MTKLEISVAGLRVKAQGPLAVITGAALTLIVVAVLVLWSVGSNPQRETLHHSPQISERQTPY